MLKIFKMNQTKVKIERHPDTGLLATEKKGKLHIRVSQSSIVFEGNFANKRTRNTYIQMDKEIFDLLGINENSTFPGRIFRIKTFNPQFEDQRPVVNPNTGEIAIDKVYKCPYYIKDYYSEDINKADEIFLDKPPVSNTVASEAPAKMEETQLV